MFPHILFLDLPNTLLSCRSPVSHRIPQKGNGLGRNSARGRFHSIRQRLLVLIRFHSLTGSASTPMALVWPTVEDVRTSVAGYVSGSSMPFSKKNNKPFMRRLFHKWKAEACGRQRHMPHMKSYLRQKDGQIAWALITSANFRYNLAIAIVVTIQV